MKQGFARNITVLVPVGKRYRKFQNKGFNRFFSHEFQYILNIWMKDAINIPCNTTR